MKLNQIVMLSLAVILFTTAVSALTVTTDKTVYNQGDTVQIATHAYWTSWARVNVKNAGTQQSVFYDTWQGNWFTANVRTDVPFNYTISNTQTPGYYYVDGHVSSGNWPTGHDANSSYFYINQKPVLKTMSDKTVLKDKQGIYGITVSDYFGSNVDRLNGRRMDGDRMYTFECDMDYYYNGAFNPDVVKIISTDKKGQDDLTTYFQYTYHNLGTYTVACKVYDNFNSATNLKTFHVTVNQYNPTTINALSIPNSIEEGTKLTLSADVTAGTGATLSTYTWEIKKDGTKIKTLTGKTADYTFASAGIYTIKLNVEDSNGETATKIATLTVTKKTTPIETNSAPTNVDFDYTNNGLIINLVGSAYDSDGDTLTYSWNLGDGTTSTGKVISYAYSDAGTYMITLKVNDGVNPEVTKTRFIIVKETEEKPTPVNHAPTAEINAQCINLTCSFNSSKSDEDGDALSVLWNLGDGTTSTESTVMHDYPQSGNYTVTLTVSDGQTSTTDTQTIEVISEEQPTEPTDETGITINAGEQISTYVNTPVQFTEEASDSNGYIQEFAWDFDGDGTYDITSINPINSNHTYTTPGIYHAIFKVIDNEGNKKIMERTIIVNEETGIPTVNAGNDLTAKTLENVNFLGTATDSDGSIVKYEWDFNYSSADGFTADYTSARDGTASHIYYKSGTYTVALRVTDNDGKTATDYITVNVTGENVNEGDTKGSINYDFRFNSIEVKRTSKYNFNDATTTVELKITNLKNEDRTFLVRDVIPKSIATYYDDFQVLPKYDIIYNTDPELGWNITIGKYETATIRYTFYKYLSAKNVTNNWEQPTIIEQKPIEETNTTTETPVTQQAGITGLVIGAMDAAGISTTALALIIVLAIIIWKKETIVEKLRRE